MGASQIVGGKCHNANRRNITLLRWTLGLYDSARSVAPIILYEFYSTIEGEYPNKISQNRRSENLTFGVCLSQSCADRPIGTKKGATIVAPPIVKTPRRFSLGDSLLITTPHRRIQDSRRSRHNTRRRIPAIP